MDDIARFQKDVGGLLAGLADPGKLKTINRKIALYLKRSTAKRIKDQEEVDGSAFAPRKKIDARTPYQRFAARKKLLSGMAKTTHLRSKYSADRLQVGYQGRAGTLAKWHNEGVVQRRKNYSIVVPQRKYMGISEQDWKAINQIVIDEM